MFSWQWEVSMLVKVAALATASAIYKSALLTVPTCIHGPCHRILLFPLPSMLHIVKRPRASKGDQTRSSKVGSSFLSQPHPGP